MALRKNVVIGADGRMQQLQSGDTVANVADTGQITQTATPTLIAGNAVYSSAADTVSKAIATAVATSKLLGLATTPITAAATGVIQCNGILALTTAQWDAVAGTTGGLAFNADYYLSPTTAGLLTATCPTTVGQTVVIVGTAISTTELRLEPTQPILL